MSARLLDLEGCFNFRDLGGWRTDDGRAVRWGRVFRADSVHLMTEADAKHAREALELRTLIDLRSDLEIEIGGVGLLARDGMSRLHLPLSSRPREAVIVDGAEAAPSPDRSAGTMAPGYLAILEASAEEIVDAVTSLARDDGLPAVFFCAAGKDRTGVLAAVILGALGVRDADIVEDYILTSDSIDRIIGRFALLPGSPQMYRDLPASHYAPLQETMVRVLDGVRTTYGSFAAYLTDKGLSASALNDLRALLLEDA